MKNHYTALWISAWCELIDGLCGIITLGRWYPMLAYKYTAWYCTKGARKGETR